VKLLLDTHVFIWWFNEPEKLSKKVLTACEDNKNELTLSVASIWEMQIKVQLGKLRLTHSIKDLISTHRATYDLQILSIFLNHVLALDNLPVHHRHPGIKSSNIGIITFEIDFMSISSRRKTPASSHCSRAGGIRYVHHHQTTV
jgi:PIN domain nuclease of toxin-antitoxin system